MGGLILYVSFFGVAISSVAETDNAITACKPHYEIVFGNCVRPESPVKVEEVTTSWILVNEGARRISDGLCRDHIKVLASQEPTATNIEVAGLKDKDAFWRGLGKSDVFCRFKMNKPVPQKINSPDCGIAAVVRQGCDDVLTMENIRDCLDAPGKSDDELWIKAGCLIDARRDAVRIGGMNSTTFINVSLQLDLMEMHFANSQNENLRRLSRFIREHR